jgi:uncharacterized protein involved in exopolysaccharide biosynthesis
MNDSGNGHWRPADGAPDPSQPAKRDWLSDAPDPAAAIDVSGLISILRRRRRFILVGALIFGLAAGLVAKFVLAKWYQAFAVIAPTPQEDLAASGNMYDVGLQLMLGDVMGSGTVTLAQKYSLIMKSYEFTMDLVDRYGLAPRLWGGKERMEAAAAKNPRTIRWRTYKLMIKRFKSEYDYKSSSLTVSFIDRDPAEAKRIVQIYVDSLRNKLREEAVSKASVIAASLEAQAVKTPDPLLQSRLYQLAAQQLQRRIVAQAQSDFFFSVIDPPLAPGIIYSPSAKLNAVGGLILGAVLCAVMAVVYDSRRMRAAQRRREAQAARAQPRGQPSQRPGDVAVGVR